jgi:hypothetical protein
MRRSLNRPEHSSSENKVPRINPRNSRPCVDGEYWLYATGRYVITVRIHQYQAKP